jgi:hypothetical protein
MTLPILYEERHATGRTPDVAPEVSHV